MLTAQKLRNEVRTLLSTTPERVPDVTIDTYTRRTEQWLNRGGVIDTHKSPPLRVIDLQKSFPIMSQESAGEGDIPFFVEGNICYFNLPDDFLQIVNLWADGYGEPMRFYAEDQFRRMVYEGIRQNMFTQVGRQVLIASYSIGSPAFRITYYSKIAPLEQGNWIANEYEQVYVDGAMAHHYSVIQDNENKTRRFSAMAKSVMNLNDEFGPMSVISAGIVETPFCAA